MDNKSVTNLKGANGLLSADMSIEELLQGHMVSMGTGTPMLYAP